MYGRERKSNHHVNYVGSNIELVDRMILIAQDFLGVNEAPILRQQGILPQLIA
jgi:hypothetical protein